jgi:hypothetical protein
VRFYPVSLGDLAFDPQVEVVQDVAVTAHSLLESVRSSALTGVIRIVVNVFRGIQFIGAVAQFPVPDLIELTEDKQLVVFGRHRRPPLSSPADR